MKINFSFSKTSKIVIMLSVLATFVLLVFINQNQIEEKLGKIIYMIKLPFRIAELAKSPPDETLLMPVNGGRVKNIADTWGGPRSGGRVHEGQDLFADRGTEVRSATRGYVVFIGKNRLGGNVVFVLGAGGRRYYYAHLDSFAPDLKYLQEVTPATLLGYVGNTGNAETTPPHLHFGVYTQAGAIDPLPLLRDRD
jgi:peptidoglycan LD-endopeptidase LytH